MTPRQIDLHADSFYRMLINPRLRMLFGVGSLRGSARQVLIHMTLDGSCFGAVLRSI
jgi:hypothetical protein